MGIEYLNPRNRADVDAVAALHEEYLSDSPVVLMGSRFMRRFYYARLVEDGLIDCLLCRADEKVVGFMSFTRYPQDFMSRGLRAHFVYLAWLMTLSVLARPAMVKDILLILRMMRERAHESETAANTVKEGEVLSMVALPEYRNHVPPGGTSRLTVRLFEDMAAYFRDEGFEAVYLLVQPSNIASNLFCSSMGCVFSKEEHAGKVTHRYTYHLQPQPVPLAAESIGR